MIKINEEKNYNIKKAYNNFIEEKIRKYTQKKNLKNYSKNQT